MVVASSEAIFWPWRVCASTVKEKLPEAFNGRGFLWKLASDANDGDVIVRPMVRCAHLDMTQFPVSNAEAADWMMGTTKSRFLYKEKAYTSKEQDKKVRCLHKVNIVADA
jgi:hypothetical protein